MDLNFREKVVLVAAASRGLGLGIARILAHEGAAVCIGARNAPGVESATKGLRDETGAEVLGLTMDASDPASIIAWTNAALEWKGRIDCLVVNAGGPPAGRFDECDDARWSAAFQLTLMSAVRMIRAALPAMRGQKAGSILAITSSSIREPIEGLLLSNVFRAGVAGLVKTLSRELAAEGIRINTIVPGRFDTDRVRELDTISAGQKGVSPQHRRMEMESMIPLGRYGTPEEFGRLAAFLLSDAAGYLTGGVFVADGGAMRSW